MLLFAFLLLSPLDCVALFFQFSNANPNNNLPSPISSHSIPTLFLLFSFFSSSFLCSFQKLSLFISCLLKPTLFPFSLVRRIACGVAPILYTIHYTTTTTPTAWPGILQSRLSSSLFLFSAMPAVVESMSPNPLPAMDSTTPSSTAASDKKRNKLGYHRTSVACGEFLSFHSH